jgi:hypothetical protein
MTLEQAWTFLEKLNETANNQSKDYWMSAEVDNAINFQIKCFRKSFSELDKIQQQEIRQWIEENEELRDYFECLSDNMIIDTVCKD